jgi:hypothetical protein
MITDYDHQNSLGVYLRGVPHNKSLQRTRENVAVFGAKALRFVHGRTRNFRHGAPLNSAVVRLEKLEAK